MALHMTPGSNPKRAAPATKLELLQASTTADRAWMAEVVSLYGEREAGMARFHGRATGEPGTRLRELYDLYIAARDAYASK
jgi:hypothetical protein